MEELQENFKKLTLEGSRVMDANEEVEAAYMAELSYCRGAKEEHQNWNRWAPPSEQKDFDCRIRELEVHLPKLVSQKAALIKAVSIKKDTEQEPISVCSSAPVATIKLKATALPKFASNQRDYYRWRKEWEALQKQGEPTGSKEVKKFQLLDSLDEKVARDLRLSTYSSSDEIFRVLENHLALEILEELQATPPVRSGHPRRIIELIQSVEKALYDLNELGNADAIKNPLVIKSIESKLPETRRKTGSPMLLTRETLLTTRTASTSSSCS